MDDMDPTDITIYSDLSEKGLLDGLSNDDIKELIKSIKQQIINEELEFGKILADNLDDNMADIIIKEGGDKE